MNKGDKGAVPVNANIVIIDAKTGGPGEGQGHVERVFRMAIDSDRWKIWNYQSLEDRLAAEIAETATDQDRRAL